MFWGPGADNKDESIEERRELSDRPKQESSSLDGEWPEVGQDDLDDDEANPAVARDGGDGANVKSRSTEIFIGQLLVCNDQKRKVASWPNVVSLGLFLFSLSI